MIDDDDYFKMQPDYEDFKEYLEPAADLEATLQLPEFQPDFSSSIIIDNVPSVGPEKLAKLKGVLLKLYVQICPTIKDADIVIPVDEATGKTMNFCFIKFSKKEEAIKAMEVTQNFQMDKKHTFKISLYSDFDTYGNMSEEYKEPTPEPFRPRPDPTSWLTDPAARDQFVIRHASETKVMWANMQGENPDVVYDGAREKSGGRVWCESYVQFSPQGTYLATFHQQGVKLWGGDNFEPQGRFIHANVAVLDFSPCENYLVTYAYGGAPNNAIAVWDIRSGTKIRSFDLKHPLDPNFQVEAKEVYQPLKLIEKCKAEGREPIDYRGQKIYVEQDKDPVMTTFRGRVETYNADKGTFSIMEGSKKHEKIPEDQVIPLQEPNRLKWSPCGKYIARLSPDIISIYSLPTMQLLDKSSLPTIGALDFQWSPKEYPHFVLRLAVGNQPSSINIVSLPDRNIVASRKLFDIVSGRMVWQSEGDYLCVYMSKVTGKKQTNILLFFRVRESEVPVEQLEVPENIVSLSWEPAGDRCAIITGDSRHGTTINFYSMSGTVVTEEVKKVVGAAPSKKGPKPKEIKQLSLLYSVSESKATEVVWSPAGGIAALVFYAPDTCMFDLHDVENNTHLATRRHDRGNRLVWDPSGRILASCTITDLKNASARGQASDGYILYTFQGNVLCNVQCEKLFQFSWRPRPKNLLSADERKKIIKNLKKYEKEFDKEDRIRRQEINQATQKQRRAQAEEFISFLIANKARCRALRADRVVLRDGYDSEDEKNYIVTTVTEETVIKTTEQPV